MKKILFLFSLFLIYSCSNQEDRYSVGVDPFWYSIQVNGQGRYLNGFISDLLLEIADEKKIDIKLVETSWDNLILGLEQEKYKCCFSTLDEYNFNQANFDFSDEILKTGYALVLRKDEEIKTLNNFEDGYIGYIFDDPSRNIIDKDENIQEVGYDFESVMLNDLKNEKIDGCILPIMVARKYVSDLFSDYLKISNDLLSPQSIKLIALKDQNKELIKNFNKVLVKLQKNKKLKMLKTKWGLE